MSALAASVAGIALILVGWEVAARLVGAVIVLPGPAAAMMALWAQIITPAFYSHLLATLLRALAGFAIAFVVGLAWGLVAGSGGTLRTVLRPLLVLIRATPVIAVILLALIWFRANVAPVVVTLLMVVPVIVENVAAGVRAASGELLEMASLFGVPRSRRLRQLTLPALRPYLFAGAHSGLGMAFKVTVAAEVLVQPGQALGGAMQEARFYLDTPRILALTVAVIALSALAEAVLQIVERLVSGEVRLGDAAAFRARRGFGAWASARVPNPVASTALSKCVRWARGPRRLFVAVRARRGYGGTRPVGVREDHAPAAPRRSRAADGGTVERAARSRSPSRSRGCCLGRAPRRTSASSCPESTTAERDRRLARRGEAAGLAGRCRGR